MNKLIKFAVLITALIFGTTEALAKSTSSRSSFKASSYKSSYKPTRYTASKPVVKPKTVKRKSSSSTEVEYFDLQDCQRHITIGFNGYKCIDRD